MIVPEINILNLNESTNAPKSQIKFELFSKKEKHFKGKF